MLKVLLMRKKLEALQNEQTSLRSKLSGFATREGEIAKQVEAAKSEEEITAAAAAVEELEKTQKTTKERLQAIQTEVEALLQEIEDAEAAGAAAANEGGNDTEEGAQERSRGGASFQRRCQEFQRTGHMIYENARSLVRTAITTANTAGPTGVGQLTDPKGSKGSALIDLIKMEDCTGMSSYTIPVVTADPDAGDGTEGQTANESNPTFDKVTLTPQLKNLISYISREIRKQTPVLYEQKVNECVRRALRKVLTKLVITKITASKLTTKLALTGASGKELFTGSLLSDIILSYGGDEELDGAAVLLLNKKDLKAFAAVEGKNEFLKPYTVTPDAANPSTGVIKDNAGLSCRYCLCKDIPALSEASLNGSPKNTMLFGNPQCVELGLWGGVDVTVNEGYKFGEGLLSVLGEVTADADLTVKDGFVVITAQTA